MSERVTALLDEEQVEYLQNKRRRGYADSISEAVRQEIDAQYVPWMTPLRRAVRGCAHALSVVTVGWLGMTLFAPVGFRWPALSMLIVVALLFGLDSALARVEPDVSNQLAGLFDGVIGR